MRDRRHRSQSTHGRHARASIAPAIVLSLVVHAAVAGVALRNWQRVTVQPPVPLTVMLEALPPPAAIQVEPPPPVERKHVAHAPQKRTLPVPPIQHTAAPTPIAVERVDVATSVVPVAPAVEPAPAPVVVAKANTTINSPGRAEAVELPHFNVAYLNNPRPAYPPVARKLGLEGVVLLRVDVSAAGTPDKIYIAQSSGAQLLDEAAMKAVQGWTFVPARRGETAIAHPVEVPIRFQLKN